MLSADDFNALWLTIELATISTLVLLLLGCPLAWWLATSQWRFKFVIEALVALPLVLPPTVLGFYLLMMMGNNGWLGQFALATTGQTLAFSFTGLVIGSVIYSLPFVVQPLQNGFSKMSTQTLEVAATLGASPWVRLRYVILPLSRSAFTTAAVLAFAHTLGEFGVVLMIGGNIPEQTRVVSIAIYDHVESLNYAQAFDLSFWLLGLSFSLLLWVYGLNRHHFISVLRLSRH